ncbi:MAG: cytochrome c oxidase subunit II [Acidobacteria bacterium]|nr:cytochrome c oxidase subunit II [Acidobacteriota bacterium]
MALLLAVLIWVITIATVVAFTNGPWKFPELISEHGQAIDDQFAITIFITGLVFFLAQMTLGYFIVRYRSRGTKDERATYNHGNTKFEIAMMVMTAVVFMALGITGQKVWAQLHLQEIPANAVEIEVTGQQFNWNFRYPGADGRFGRLVPKLIDDATNPLGLDDTDPAAKDDVRATTIAIPIDQPVKLLLRSKDVIHSFFSPNLRIKQDAVPGMLIPVHFKATKTGRYEILCVELCGMQHFKMKTYLDVMNAADFNKWLIDQSAQ